MAILGRLVLLGATARDLVGCGRDPTAKLLVEVTGILGTGGPRLGWDFGIESRVNVSSHGSSPLLGAQGLRLLKNSAEG